MYHRELRRARILFEEMFIQKLLKRSLSEEDTQQRSGAFPQKNVHPHSTTFIFSNSKKRTCIIARTSSTTNIMKNANPLFDTILPRPCPCHKCNKKSPPLWSSAGPPPQQPRQRNLILRYDFDYPPSPVRSHVLPVFAKLGQQTRQVVNALAFSSALG